MKPFLREVGRARLAPVGWTAQPAGVWAGREVEVVFDPERHQVTKFMAPPPLATKTTMAAEGFRRVASDGHQELWVRDLSATRLDSITAHSSAAASVPQPRVARGL